MNTENLPLTFPSIFNDVIGPVMRGPSSSHCVAALRIGRLARDLIGDGLVEVVIEYDAHGSLATTHASQGFDMGLQAGLLGWEATDERLAHAPQVVAEAGIGVRISVTNLHGEHPNTCLLTLRSLTEQHTLRAISTGGGMISVLELDGIKLSMAGDYYETLLYLDSEAGGLMGYLAETLSADDVLLWGRSDLQIVEIKAQAFLDAETVSQLRSRFKVRYLKELAPVLPVVSRKPLVVPFITSAEMLRYNAAKNLTLWELGRDYESARGNLTGEQVFHSMGQIVEIMEASIRQGVAGTTYADRILGHQSGAFQACNETGRLLDLGMLNQVILYVTAMMEVKSAMGVIVAAPTAGACGVLPGACFGAAAIRGLSRQAITEAMLAAGMIGVFIAAHATFAAEIGGCQAECGAGSGMAAAALVTLAGGSVAQALAAASLALQNTFGMTCDPVANRVEVPCLGKNIMAASNALACANMALAGYDPVIPLDEVIEAMDRVGRKLPRELRCTGLDGLSTTPTAKAIELRLAMPGADAYSGR